MLSRLILGALWGKVELSEELWAKHGLTGLVLFALFVVVIIGLRMAIVVLRDARAERKAMREEMHRERRVYREIVLQGDLSRIEREARKTEKD